MNPRKRRAKAAFVVAFLSHRATVEDVAGATQNQALNALNFLYTQVLELRDFSEAVRARERSFAGGTPALSFGCGRFSGAWIGAWFFFQAKWRSGNGEWALRRNMGRSGF